MKKAINFIFVMLIFNCTVKNDGHWKSEKTNLELNFNDNWEIIALPFDSDETTIIGIKDTTDNSSLVVKITEDVSKEQVSDEKYLTVIKEQMLNANSSNKLIFEGKIQFKKKEYSRLVFFMITLYGEIIQTIYTHRNGKKVTSIQIVYPQESVKQPIKEIPKKIEKILNEMKI